jgi:hypothetical protein
VPKGWTWRVVVAGVALSLVAAGATAGAVLRAPGPVRASTAPIASDGVQVISGNVTGFRIAGSVGGLYPGSVRTLHLKLTNTLAVSLVVTSVKTTVGATSAVCAASFVQVAAFAGHVSIPAHGTGAASVHVTMAHASPNGCQGATFTFRYRGLGTAQ